MERVSRREPNPRIVELSNIAKFAPPDKCEQVDAFVRGASQRTMSSLALGWQGLVIERHRADASQRQERTSSHHILALWERHTFHTEHNDGRGRMARVTKRPGYIDFFPAGILSACRPTGPSEMTVCAFHPEFAKEVEQELDLSSVDGLRGFSTTEDETLRSLMKMLVVEVEMNGFHGQLYADHLTHALMTHVLFLVRGKRKDKNVSGLPNHLLQRVEARMRADLSADLRLSALASECGYSRTHFLQMFRKATGYTPHRYLLHLRLEAACQLMRQKSRSLIDIAAECGFSSHGHLTRAFRQTLEVTPSRLRRSL
jgi:AraC family transcriptional regulator